MKGILTSLSLLLLFLVFISTTQAVEFNVSENGSGSKNSINFNQSGNTTVNQNSNANINNNINATANTGGNEASNNTGGNTTIKTGDASVKVNVDNKLNNNSAVVNCCTTPTPKKPTSTPPSGPTSTPKPGNGNGNGNGGNGGGGNGGAGVGGPAGGGQVLGLAPTGGENTASIFYILGVLCFALGGAALGRGKIAKR
ncbi:hypothetical protein HY407_04635 [Candidatus Gottesmanbacteria bacterium]|nr:hypothetical protein [Candidatus Gottesmanbacteria bacterium]